jgi:hypothetical protein
MSSLTQQSKLSTKPNSKTVTKSNIAAQNPMQQQSPIMTQFE